MSNIVKAKLRIARTIKAIMSKRWVAGKPIVTTDTGELYIGLGDNLDAIKITDIIQVDSLPITGLKNKIYINNKTNQLYIWNGSKFNPLMGNGGVEVYNTFQSMPQLGSKNIIYVVLSDESFYPTSNRSIYVWNNVIGKYVLCSRGISSKSFSSIKINNISIGARNKQDELEIKVGEGLSISGNQTTNTITISQTTKPKTTLSQENYKLDAGSLINLPSNLTYTTAEVIADNVYILGGYNGSVAINNIYRYNITNNTVEDFGSIPLARLWAMSCVYNGNIYLFGGKTVSSRSGLNDFWMYDVDANNWVLKPPMNVARYGAFCAVIGSKLWVIGGQNTTYTRYIEYYDFILNQWILLEESVMPTARSLGSTFVFNDLIYCVGGRVSDNNIDTTVNEVFNTTTLSWEIKSPLPISRWGSGYQTFGGLAYVLLGNHRNSNVKTIYMYNPIKDCWILADNRAPITKACFATVLYNGKIFMFGGNNSLSRPYYNTCNSYAIISEKVSDLTIINAIKPNNISIINTSTGEFSNTLALVQNDIWQFGSFKNINATIVKTEKQS